MHCGNDSVMLVCQPEGNNTFLHGWALLCHAAKTTGSMSALTHSGKPKDGRRGAVANIGSRPAREYQQLELTRASVDGSDLIERLRTMRRLMHPNDVEIGVGVRAEEQKASA